MFGAFFNHLENKYGSDYEFSHDRSRQSEAHYINVYHLETNKEHKVSFRNHDNFGSSSYDTPIWLSHHNTWTDCKKHFLDEVLPDVFNELQKVREEKNINEELSEWKQDEKFKGFLNKYPALSKMTKDELIEIDLLTQKDIQLDQEIRLGYSAPFDVDKRKTLLNSYPKEFTIKMIQESTKHSFINEKLESIISSIKESEVAMMELPKKYLENLKKRITADFHKGYNRYQGKTGAKQLAIDLGESLAMMQEKEANYVIENAYDDLYKNIYNNDLGITKEDWDKTVKDNYKPFPIDLAVEKENVKQSNKGKVSSKKDIDKSTEKER